MICKFCGCSESRPCLIHMAVPSKLCPGELVLGDFPCAWLLYDVCTAPACVEKAFAEARPLAETIQTALDLGLIELAA